MKAERYLGVQPYFLADHPHAEELIAQAFDSMWIDAELERVKNAHKVQR